ncbi:MAG: glycosyltransferase family 39 protein [Candidatus Omnitrophica bacterium]|nr:glycosyltransferase family 39 protein [Candidatus Omnitrophota bacterium]
MKNTKYFSVIAVAILIKILLFAFLVMYAPQSRFQSDSRDYLETAQVLSSRGAFAKADSDGSLRYELFRTPGYPVFLAFLQGLMKVPLNGVILFQVFLAILAAWITYKAALQIDYRIAFLSAVIVLYDPPISIFSLIILSETLFLFLTALFMLSFVLYLRNNKTGPVILSALMLAAATYVRPITYYLGAAVAIFIIYARIRVNFKRAFIHALIFLVIVYGLLGAWQVRNYKQAGQKTFCSVIQGNCAYMGLAGSYARFKDSIAKGMGPAHYYASATSRCFLSLMTRPGPFKYFKSAALSVAGRVLAYPWLVFWIIGFIAGIMQARRNIYYQFMFFIILYFIFTSIGGAGWIVGERFRIPMVPFIAVTSAAGWVALAGYWARRKEKVRHEELPV